jgi:hypothetical protein
MASRKAGLAAFYGGPVWQRHREAANATMVDSDDVLLLRPLTALPRPHHGRGPWTITIGLRQQAPDPALLGLLRASGDCWLETEPARQPVREGVHALVAITREPPVLPADLLSRQVQPLLRLHLLPTACSALC